MILNKRPGFLILFLFFGMWIKFHQSVLKRTLLSSWKSIDDKSVSLFLSSLYTPLARMSVFIQVSCYDLSNLLASFMMCLDFFHLRCTASLITSECDTEPKWALTLICYYRKIKINNVEISKPCMLTARMSICIPL